MSARRLALITGASAGLGAEFARAYAARGFDLALAARRVDRLDALATELTRAHGIEAFSIGVDLAVYGAERLAVDAVAARGRHVDVLVNNAGFSIPQSFAAVPWERQRDFLMTLLLRSRHGRSHPLSRRQELHDQVFRGAGGGISASRRPRHRPVSRLHPHRVRAGQRYTGGHGRLAAHGLPDRRAGDPGGYPRQ
jgi:NAD(P)-dependent dehydrogenase (short-subunit alcohol dehydrogenase family)